MNDLDRINQDLRNEWPAAWACMSALGRRAVFPKGIPFQAGQARGTDYNATIGQVTDGAGAPMPLPCIAEAFAPLPARMSHLYSPPSGHVALRQAWQARQRTLSGGSRVATTLPFVCRGLTQVINFAAELFVDQGTSVIVPGPRWGNYDQVLAMRRNANLVQADLFVDGAYSLAPLLKALRQTEGPAMLVLNFPHNPSGFTPSTQECAELVDAVLAHPGPLTVLVDDAYAGMMWGEDLPERSLFWDLAERHDPTKHVILRADGVTKEMFFFPGRVGFLTAAIEPESPAAAALESKLGSLARSGNGSPPGPSQAAVLTALQDPTLEAQIAAGNSALAHRWALLEAALDEAASPYLRPYPFNSGVFAMVGLADGVRADEARLRLIEEQSVGLVSIGAIDALRIAYCSVAAKDIVPLVHRMAQGLTP